MKWFKNIRPRIKILVIAMIIVVLSIAILGILTYVCEPESAGYPSETMGFIEIQANFPSSLVWGGIAISLDGVATNHVRDFTYFLLDSLSDCLCLWFTLF